MVEWGVQPQRTWKQEVDQQTCARTRPEVEARSGVTERARAARKLGLHRHCLLFPDLLHSLSRPPLPRELDGTPEDDLEADLKHMMMSESAWLQGESNAMRTREAADKLMHVT